MSLAAPLTLVTPADGASAAAPAIRAERWIDAAVVEGLIDRAFGPGRFAKTAERLRENSAPDLALSFVAWSEGVAVGCVRQWPVTIGGTPALLLGPFAVEDAWRRRGLGAALIRQACEAATEAGHGLIVLVGNPGFFGPLGFSAELARRARLPGPVDPRRLMVRALRPGAADGLEGLVAA